MSQANMYVQPSCLSQQKGLVLYQARRVYLSVTAKRISAIPFQKNLPFLVLLSGNGRLIFDLLFYLYTYSLSALSNMQIYIFYVIGIHEHESMTYCKIFVWLRLTI